MPAKVTYAEDIFTFLEQLPDVVIEELEYEGLPAKRITLPIGSLLKTLGGTTRYGVLIRRPEVPGSRHSLYVLKRRDDGNSGWRGWLTIRASHPLTLWWPGELPPEEQETNS